MKRGRAVGVALVSIVNAGGRLGRESFLNFVFATMRLFSILAGSIIHPFDDNQSAAPFLYDGRDSRASTDGTSWITWRCDMSHLLVIGFANEQKAKEGANKLLSLQKRGEIEIQDALIATKDERGAVALTQLSDASSFWEIRAAASGYPAPPAAGALTDFGSDEKFVKDIAEAIPSGRAAVFVLTGKRLKEGALDGSMTGEGVVFFDSYDKSAAGAIRAAFSKWKGNGRG
jgi:uncharacterized membrane protein